MSEPQQATALKEQINKQNILKKIRDNRAKNMKRKSQSTINNPMFFSATQASLEERKEETSPKPKLLSHRKTVKYTLDDANNSHEIQLNSTLNQSIVHDTSLAQLDPEPPASHRRQKLGRYKSMKQITSLASSPYQRPSGSASDPRQLGSMVEEPPSPRMHFGGNTLENTRAILQSGSLDEEESFNRQGNTSRRLKKLLSQNMAGMSRQSSLRPSIISEKEAISKESFLTTIKSKLKLFFRSKDSKSQEQQRASPKEEDEEANSAKEEIKRRERVLQSVISKMTKIRDENHQKSEELKNYIQTDIMAEDEGASLKKKKTIQGFVRALNLRKSGFVIPEDHPMRNLWNFVVIIMAAAVSCLIPMELAFIDFEFNTAFHWVIDLVFGLDILANMTTSFYHPEAGEIVKNPKVIRKYYLTSFGFALDLLAVLPIQVVFPNPYFNFRLLKLLKLLRLRPASLLTIHSETAKLSMKIFTLFFYLLFYIHVTACYLYFVIEKEKVWEPSRTLFQGADLYNTDLMTRYLTCFYTSIMILMGNDTKPETNSQMGVVCFLSITGALIIANVFGTITVVVSALNRKSQKFQEKIDMASTSMANMKLPPSIQQDIREFMMSTQNNLDTQKELDAFMQMISPSLRNQVTKHIFLNAIASNPVLQGSQDVIDFLINDVSTLLYLPEDRIINQGEHGGSLYLIAKGDCSVWVVDHMRQQRFVRQLNQGEYFGEVSILNETPRTATVKSQNYCTLACLSTKTFFDLCNNFPQIIARMRERTLDYDDPWKQFKKKVLGQIDYFEKPNAESEYFLEEVQYHLQEEYFEKGTEIVGPDYPTKQIVFIVQGLVDLIVFDQEGNEVELDTLGQGSHIGQYSALFDEAPIFSAVAKTRVRVLTLSQEFFLENKDVIEGLEDAIFQCEDTVEEAGIPLCDYQKFFKQDNIKSKFLRARRKAHVLENSLLISQLMQESKQKQRKNSRLNINNFSKEKRQSIMIRRDDHHKWPPKRKAKRKPRGSFLVPPSSNQDSAPRVKQRRLTIAQPSTFQRVLSHATGIQSGLLLVPENPSSSSSSSQRSSRTSSSSSSSSISSEPSQKLTPTITSSSSSASADPSDLAEQRKKILRKKSSMKQAKITFRVNGISEISEEVKEEDNATPAAEIMQKQYDQLDMRLYNSDYSSEKHSPIHASARVPHRGDPSPSQRDTSFQVLRASSPRLVQQEDAIIRRRTMGSLGPSRPPSVPRKHLPKTKLSMRSQTHTSSSHSHQADASLGVRGINEARRMITRRLTKNAELKNYGAFNQ